MKNYQDGGEAILEALRRLKTDYVISSPGSEWAPFWEALARQKRDGTEGPSYIDVGHESIAVNMATAYTKITGKMQAVMLHAGAGMLQGAMAVDAAGAMETPLVIMSGEVLGYGEGDVDPGSQWYRNLSVVGGTQHLVDPVVKWSQQVASINTLHESIVRAGEMAQRGPKGPTYLCIPMETMLEPWDRPELLREVPPAPKSAPLSEDIERVAISLTSAKCPVISTANLGPDIDAFDALVVLAETLGAPVVEGQDAFFGNFPKSHDLYLGQSIESLLPEMDMALLVESRAPWYPPSNRPTDARIIAIGENPLKEHMVYQTMHADTYLEGDTATTLKMLVDALEKHDLDKSVIAQRREKWRKAHDELLERISTAEVEAASATTMIAIATTQPQLRLRPGGLGLSPRGGISCGPAAFCAVNTSVGGSLGRLITWVEPASKPEGAVNRRSSGWSRAPGAFGSAGAITSVAGSCSDSGNTSVRSSWLCGACSSCSRRPSSSRPVAV